MFMYFQSFFYLTVNNKQSTIYTMFMYFQSFFYVTVNNKQSTTIYTMFCLLDKLSQSFSFKYILLTPGSQHQTRPDQTRLSV